MSTISLNYSIQCIYVRTLVLAFLLIAFLNGCKKDVSSNNIHSIPSGTTVKLQASSNDGSSIPIIQYFDSQQNLIALTNVASNWTITYQTSRPNQLIFLQVAGSTSPISGKIYINGDLKKEASGNFITISIP